MPCPSLPTPPSVLPAHLRILAIVRLLILRLDRREAVHLGLLIELEPPVPDITLTARAEALLEDRLAGAVGVGVGEGGRLQRAVATLVEAGVAGRGGDGGRGDGGAERGHGDGGGQVELQRGPLAGGLGGGGDAEGELGLDGS